MLDEHPLSLSFIDTKIAMSSPQEASFLYNLDRVLAHAADKRTWHREDSRGQMLALAFRQKSLKRFKLFPLCSDGRKKI